MSARYQIIYHPLAEKEYLESVNWYEKNQTGLGSKFIIETEKVIDKIEVNPFLFPVKKMNFREAVLKTFPFIIVYKILPKTNTVHILSVFHASKDPVKKHQRK